MVTVLLKRVLVDKMAETLCLRGTLTGHNGWVTAIATPLDPNSDTILSSSRYVNLWKIDPEVPG